MPKTIFGTTEKSNFILNMKSSTLNKWINGVLVFCIVLPLIGGIMLTESDTKTFLAGFCAIATGFVSILFFLIVALKKEISLKQNKSYILIIAMAVLALISYYAAFINISGTAFEESTPLLGNIGRQEGFLSILAYFGIFLLATCIRQEKAVKRLLDILLFAGIVQSVIAILQHIPCNFPSDYRDLPTIFYTGVNLSSGLTDSPIFYGSLMTVMTSVAISGAIYEENRNKAVFYSLCAVLFLVTSLFTSSVVPLIGIGFAVILTVTIQIINSRKGSCQKFDSKYLKTPTARLIAVLSLLLISFIIVALTQGINLVDIVGIRKIHVLRDKSIAFYDSFYRLFVTGSMVPINSEGLYKIAWSNSLELIKQSPLLGVGPDCMAIANFMNGKTNDFLDKSYNEFLYVAVTRGIPSLVAYLALVIYAVRKLIINSKGFLKHNSEWFRAALLVAVTAYLVQSFFSVSAITVAPYFWLLLGISCSSFLDIKTDNK